MAAAEEVMEAVAGAAASQQGRRAGIEVTVAMAWAEAGIAAMTARSLPAITAQEATTVCPQVMLAAAKHLAKPEVAAAVATETAAKEAPVEAVAGAVANQKELRAGTEGKAATVAVAVGTEKSTACGVEAVTEAAADAAAS